MDKINNYRYLENKWRQEYNGRIPIGPVEGIEDYRKRLHERWLQHCDLDDKHNVSDPEDSVEKPSFLDWLTNQADRAFDFKIGELVRVDGSLGIIRGYTATVYHGHGAAVSRYETLLIHTAKGTKHWDASVLIKEESLPAEVLELAKAQLLGECPEVCPLRKE